MSSQLEDDKSETSANESKKYTLLTFDKTSYVNPVTYFHCDEPSANPLQNLMFIDKFGSKVKSNYVLKNKDVLALYFAQANCSKNARILPFLKEIHKKAEEYKKRFEVIYVSYDTTKEEMLNNLRVNHGYWYAIDFDEPLRLGLGYMYGILAVPQLIVTDSAGMTITRTGFEEIEKLGINVLVTWF